MTDPAVEPAVDPTPEPGPGPALLPRLLAEAGGTFVLVLVGCGTWAFAGATRSFSVLAVALAFGAAYALLTLLLRPVSGGHVNPAVSVASAVSGRLSWRDAGAYAAAQVAGAIVGALVLLVLLQGFPRFDLGTDGLGQNYFGDEGTGYAWWAAMLLELLMTTALVLVVLSTLDRRTTLRTSAPVVIGVTVTALHLLALPATGAALNPARILGPALFAGLDSFGQAWVLVVATLLGALLAGVLHPLLLGRDGEPVPGSGLRMPARRPTPARAGTGAATGAGTDIGAHAETAETGTETIAYQAQWDEQLKAGRPIVQDGWQWDPHAQQWIPAPPDGPGPEDQRS